MMRPMAEMLLKAPMTRDAAGRVREFLSGCQFFECSALDPVYNVRNPLTPSEFLMEELLAMELPAEASYLERGPRDGVAISDRKALLGPGERFALMRFGLKDDGSAFGYFFQVLKNGELKYLGKGQPRDSAAHRDASMCVRWAVIAMEAMQTPGGFTHNVLHEPSRQMRRAAAREGKPCHRWVEIRLGRPRGTAGGEEAARGPGVAWHYRRGHRVNHPNPNYPKWRKGCWVGSPDYGIRSHDYILEPPIQERAAQ